MTDNDHATRWADKAIEDMKASYEAELAAVRTRCAELEMRALVAKPLYSRRQLQERIATLEHALQPFANASRVELVGVNGRRIYCTQTDIYGARAALDAIKEG